MTLFNVEIGKLGHEETSCQYELWGTKIPEHKCLWRVIVLLGKGCGNFCLFFKLTLTEAFKKMCMAAE